MTETLPAAPTFLADGSISAATAQAITNFCGPADDWFRFCQDCWDTRYGSVTVFCPDYPRGRDVEITFITGGWWNNEIVLHAMERNRAMWVMTWCSSHQGGTTVFQWEEKGAEPLQPIYCSDKPRGRKT